MKIYTAQFGELRVDTLIRKTKQGYRVKSATGFEQVVAMRKQFSGSSHFKGDKLYYQQVACETLQAAKDAVKIQLEAFAAAIKSQQEHLDKKAIDAMYFTG